MTAVEYIKKYTKRCSNELVSVEDRYGKKVISYREWLTPENAIAAVNIARQENALTWQDIQRIVQIADHLFETRWMEWKEKGQEAYYREVLRQFNLAR